MAAPPIWIHAVIGFFAATFSIVATWLVGLLLRSLLKKSDVSPFPLPPHVVSFCYDPTLDLTTLQYSNGEQLFLPGPPIGWNHGPPSNSRPSHALPPSFGEPISVDRFRQMLDAPGDGAAVGVQFTQEGGFREKS